MNTTAYAEGVDARWLDEDAEDAALFADNPYDCETQAYAEWDRGYRDASREIEQMNIGRP